MGPKKSLTKSEREHQDQVRALGCWPCRKIGFLGFRAEIHHVVECRKRLGPMQVLPLCGWHHRGESPDIDMRPSEAEEMLGPSLARSKKSFIARFGSERDQLAEVAAHLEGKA